MDVDDIYSLIGEFGPRQKLYFFSLALFNIIPPFHMIQIVFTGETPSFICTSENGTLFKNSCPNNQTKYCSQIDFFPRPDTFSREWNLICDTTYQTKLIQSIFMAGVLVGALVCGPISDKFGRRTTLFFTFICVFGIGVAESIMPSFYPYAVARFLSGIFVAGNMISMFVLASELVGPNMRGLCGNIIQSFFALGIMLFSLIAYWVNNWRLLSLVSAGLGAFLLFTFIWLPESPRWLLLKGRTDEALKILRGIAASNGKELPRSFTANLKDYHSNSMKKNSKGSDGLCSLCSKPKICIIIVVQLFSWFVNSIVYYGLTLASDQLGSDIYVSTALSGLVEVPAYILSAILIEIIWFGRRITTSIFMVLGGLSCIGFKFFNLSILALFGKLAIAASFAIIYIQSTELFPTSVRNSGLGLCSCFARIGGIVAPFVSMADSMSPNAQFIILGVLSFFSGLLNLLLPETLHKPMPETSRDLEVLLGGYVPLENHDEDENNRQS